MPIVAHLSLACDIFKTFFLSSMQFMRKFREVSYGPKARRACFGNISVLCQRVEGICVKVKERLVTVNGEYLMAN